MTHGSLFSGIGGFDLAAEWMGWENKFHCEWNEFGQKVLHHYWPQAELFTDITKSDFKKYNGAIDIISGGFPCQPYSSAGKRLGKEDSRHLWPEMLRAIREIQPRWVVGENVRGLTNWNGGLVFDEVQSELEAQGYEVTPFLLPACAVNAPHRRDRIFFVAYSNLHGLNQCNGNNEVNTSEGRFNALGNINKSNGNGDVTDTNNEGFKSRTITERNDQEGRQEQSRPIEQFTSNARKTHSTNWGNFPTTEPTIRVRNDGFSSRLDGITFPKWRNESIKAAGNAIVPQVVYQIFKAIQEYERIGDTSPNH
jgi:DNA (cytosine-5)-methyltransferase 1